MTLFIHDFVMFRLTELWQYEGQVYMYIQSGNVH